MEPDRGGHSCESTLNCWRPGTECETRPRRRATTAREVFPNYSQPARNAGSLKCFWIAVRYHEGSRESWPLWSLP